VNVLRDRLKKPRAILEQLELVEITPLEKMGLKDIMKEAW
jgi:hypothetical protein